MQFFVKLLSNPGLVTQSFFCIAFFNKHSKVIINSSAAVLLSRLSVVYVCLGGSQQIFFEFFISQSFKGGHLDEK